MADMMDLGFLAALGAVGLFAAAMLRAAISDVLTMTVSDRLVIMLIGSFVILAPLSGWSVEEIALSVAAATMVFFASVALFALGWMGGGDGKLATAATLWLGAHGAIDFVTTTALFGGMFALSFLMVRSLELPLSWKRKPWIARLHAADTGIPYAVPLALAGLSVLPASPWMGAII